jgi:hypothetical protein
MYTYRVRDLPGLPGDYVFQTDDDHVYIPGHGGGRDGPTTADRPEQEAWMRTQGLHESWYLTWDLPGGEATERFRAMLIAAEI